MANVNAPSGLSPVAYMDGSSWSMMGRAYFIPSTDTNAYAIGDPMAAVRNSDTFGTMAATLATAGSGNAILGALMAIGINRTGPWVDPRNLSTIIAPATKTVGYYALIADDPSILFEIQEGGSGTALAATTGAGMNVNLKSGTNNGFLSGWTFDNATTGTGSTIQLKLIGLAQRTDNTFGANAKWLVRINNHFYSAGTAGI